MSGEAEFGHKTSRLLEPWSGLTLVTLLEKAVNEAPARIFMRDCPERERWSGIEPRVLSCDHFQRGTRFLAAQLRMLGLQAGERALILLPNCVEAFMSVIACRMIGAVPAVAPVDETPEFLRQCVERVQAALILTSAHVGDVATGEKARHAAAKVLCVRAVAGFGFDLVDGIVSLEGWSEEDVDPLPEIFPRQEETALVTFTRRENTLVAYERSEAQLVAEALALSSVLRLDGRRGLISLMQPGASATLAASLTLPLYAAASVRLIGPYVPTALEEALKAEPTAFLFAPDHFLSSLDEGAFSPKLFTNTAGMLGLARLTSPQGEILPCGPLGGALALDFAEAGLMTCLKWPQDGALNLPARFEHPMDSVLPEDMPMLEWHGATLSGFGAAPPVRPSGKNATQAA